MSNLCFVFAWLVAAVGISTVGKLLDSSAVMVIGGTMLLMLAALEGAS